MTMTIGISPKARINQFRPVAWYQFGRGITSAAGKVSQWNDATSNARHLVQATGSNQPALQTDGSLLFDGATSFMEVGFTLAQPTMVYILFRQVTWSSGGVVFDGESAAQSGQLVQTSGSPQLNLNAGSAVAANTGLAVNTYGIAACAFNGASSSLGINKGAVVTGNAGTASMSGLNLGGDTNDANFANIQVKEIIMFAGAHGATQQLQVINYLSMVGGLGL
jgi:hypothetical protein